MCLRQNLSSLSYATNKHVTKQTFDAKSKIVSRSILENNSLIYYLVLSKSLISYSVLNIIFDYCSIVILFLINVP